MMATSRERTYRPLPLTLDQKLREEIRFLWDAIYDLRDHASPDVQVVKLGRKRLIDLATYEGKPLIVIILQDGTGGLVPVFPDKFKGINTIIWDTSPNTYTVVYMYPLKADQVLCVAGVTGGSLA